MTGTSLHAAHNFVTALHRCKLDRPAIAWATWDLIAMVEGGRQDVPATHALTFVWNGHNEEIGKNQLRQPIKVKDDMKLKLDFPKENITTSILLMGTGGTQTSSPTEKDENWNINNVIMIGDTASVRPKIQPQQKDANLIQVIERPLTENERFMLAKAARCIAFSVCPIRLVPK
ncbi:hypothetical protein REPUB_Repub09cG0028100 [Reevesia pubescens]